MANDIISFEKHETNLVTIGHHLMQSWILHLSDNMRNSSGLELDSLCRYSGVISPDALKRYRIGFVPKYILSRIQKIII